ncbi:hypothetical protein BDN72DRAFT_778923 [Pluteus cervinus]|uniref:Uncharacterized protein n=1 Tax=Pluteus cervinus TaxID=181527 RepID=A0ACD3A541_9AGAR|nr:hypothetical protein BDN72DRAFT_778923 [Pluteus cervinus]
MAVRNYYKGTQGLASMLGEAFEVAFPEYHKEYLQAFKAGVWVSEDPGPWLGRAIIWKLQVQPHMDASDVGPTAAFNCGSYDDGPMYLPDLDIKLAYAPGDLLIFLSGILYHAVGHWEPTAHPSGILTPGRIGNVFFFPKQSYLTLKGKPENWNWGTMTGACAPVVDVDCPPNEKSKQD